MIGANGRPVYCGCDYGGHRDPLRECPRPRDDWPVGDYLNRARPENYSPPATALEAGAWKLAVAPTRST